MKRLLAAASLVASVALANPSATQTIVPRAGTTATIVTGGSAVTLLTGPVNGCYVTNPLLAADQGIVTAEPAYVDPVNTAGTAGNGTTSALQPGQSWACVPQSYIPVTANAATSGHKLTVVIW